MSRSLVNTATSDDQSLPGGYLLKQLSDRTLKSISDSNDIEGYLRNRLSKRSPDIKYKALLCIKYISANGNDTFKLNFQRDNQIIRECTHFKGVDDPLRGDRPNQKVRDMAKDTMIAVFATNNNRSNNHKMIGISSNNSNNNNNNNNKSYEYSQGTYHIPSTQQTSTPKLESGAYSTGNMKGFGNPAFNNNANDNSFVNKLKNKFGNSNYPKSYQSYESKGVYKAPSSVSNQSSSYNNSIPAPAQAHVESLRKRGQVGGGWNTASIKSSNGSSSSSAHPPPPKHYAHNNNNNNNNNMSKKNVRVSKASNGEYESKLVDDITVPSGVRTLPKPKEIREFINKARNLDGVLLASIIQGKFSSNDWRTQLKALCLVEALINNGFKEIAEYFTHELSELVEFENSNIKQIQSKASVILILLNIKERDSDVNKQESVVGNSPQSNLLPDLLDESSLNDNHNNHNHNSESMNSESNSNKSSLFADMSVKATSPQSEPNIMPNKDEKTDDPLAALFDNNNNNNNNNSSNEKDPFGLFSEDAKHNNNDPLQSLMGNVSISSPIAVVSPKSPPKSNSYEEFSSLPLTMDPASSSQFGYQQPTIGSSSPPKSNMMDFTVQKAPNKGSTGVSSTALRPANLFDDLTSNKPAVSVQNKEDKGFNFVDSDSFAFVQNMMK